MTTTMEVDRSLPVRPRPEHLMTLVLNADYQPLTTFPLKLIPAVDAITKIWLDRVDVVDTWKDAFGEEVCFHSPSVTIPAPKVIVLREYINIHRGPKFTRRAVFLRDRYTCQYCGKKFPAPELTWDHLIPKSAGGKSEWTNVITACQLCNEKKADKMPDFSGRTLNGLRPLKMPTKPTNAQLLKAGMELLPSEMRLTYSEWLYWSVELEP